MKEVQANLQLGFTVGLTPGLASLIITEASTEAEELGVPLLMCTLDVCKAIDTCSHQSIVRKMYLADIDHDVLAIVDSMYQNMKSKVQWKGFLSQEFTIQQGTRQGGVLSANLYKLYINDFLVQLEEFYNTYITL